MRIQPSLLTFQISCANSRDYEVHCEYNNWQLIQNREGINMFLPVVSTELVQGVSADVVWRSGQYPHSHHERELVLQKEVDWNIEPKQVREPLERQLLAEKTHPSPTLSTIFIKKAKFRDMKAPQRMRRFVLY